MKARSNSLWDFRIPAVKIKLSWETTTENRVEPIQSLMILNEVDPNIHKSFIVTRQVLLPRTLSYFFVSGPIPLPSGLSPRLSLAECLSLEAIRWMAWGKILKLPFRGIPFRPLDRIGWALLLRTPGVVNMHTKSCYSIGGPGSKLRMVVICSLPSTTLTIFTSLRPLRRAPTGSKPNISSLHKSATL